MKDDESERIDKDFKKAVNMTAGEIEKWLKTEESRKVGYKSEEGGESVGHQSGKKIIKILESKQADLTDADFKHMEKVAGYVHRHLAQRPDGDISETNWRYSLMNWGHDPKKK